MAATPKRVFITYAWEDEEYRSWVKRLASRLREDGVDARLDAWHREADDPIPDFMNREVRQADCVLVLCSPGYRTKVHAAEDGVGVTGVGWESGLLNARSWAGKKGVVLAALTRGDWPEAAPDFLLGHAYADLSKPSSFEGSYRESLRNITGAGEQAPPLGELPSNLEPQPVAPLRGGQVSGDVVLEFTLRAHDGGWRTSLSVDGAPPVVAPFGLDLAAADSQTARDLVAIRENHCSADDIRNLGSELWGSLLEGQVGAEYARARKLCRARPGAVLRVRLVLPPELENVPWEAVCDFDEDSLGTSPKVSVVRWPADEAPPERRAGKGGPLTMLVVIPGGSSLGTSGEWERIRQCVAAVGQSIHLVALDGRVTTNRLAQFLRRHWDLVHFIGHGRLDDSGRLALRFNKEEGGIDDEDWVPGNIFARQFSRSRSRFVLVNCCHAGSVDPTALSGLGASLTKAGMPAVLLMRYAIRDNAAADFSAAFYRELLSGERPGRVDLAVQEGRAALERTYREEDRVRSYITPVLYLATGFEQLVPETLAEGEVADTKGEVEAAIDLRIDRRLVNAVQSASCLPILGPGILAAAAERHAPSPPGPRELARRLAELSDFPGIERVTPLAESVADWLTPFLLERICQHFESVAPGERRALNEAVGEIYRPFRPHPLLDELAAWPVPGIVYTFIDGLFEQSLRRVRGRELRVVQAADVPARGEPTGRDLLLVNLRGTWTSAEASLPAMVLTEEDADEVRDRMDLVGRLVADVMNRVGGCTLLFLGVSPRDPLVRTLARRLLHRDSARSRATAFFVGQQVATADRSYWQQFPKVEWLDLDVETVMIGLSAAARLAKGSK